MDEEKIRIVMEGMREAKFTYKQTLAISAYMKIFIDEYLKALKE